jgi:hypothetical protein
MMKKVVTMETICLPSEDVVAREIEGDIIIVPLVAGVGDTDDELYTLSETGKAIWQALDGEKTLGQVISELCSEFSSSPGSIEKDVLGFITEMIRRGMIVVKD